MKQNMLSAIRLTIVCLFFFSGVYTMVVYAIAQCTPNKGQGDLLTVNGKTYYTNVAQRFTEDKYFWSRPSAVDYNAAGAGGSNKGPSNPEYLAQVQARVDTFLVHNPGVAKAQIPSDLVTASGSGLDPDISVAAAKIQIPRIARVRHLEEKDLQLLVQQQTENLLFGLLGTEKINVLKLNLALDQINHLK